MRALLLTLLFLLKITFTSANTNVKTISFNLRLDVPSDGINQWSNRKEAWINFVKGENPDFICIQEALLHQVLYIDSMLTDFTYIGVGRDDGKNAGEFMAIFYKESTWALEKENTFWLSDTPNTCTKGWDAMCFRVCTWGIFNHKTTGFKFVVNNTHLDHKGEIARSKSIDLLIEHIQKLNPEVPTILVGDFNFKPDDMLYVKITSHLLDSKWLADLILETYEGTFNGFDLVDYRPPYKDRIDYVFCNKKYNVLEYKVPVSLTNEGYHISDHFPVIVTLSFD